MLDDVGFDGCTDELFELIMEVAGGKRVHSGKLDKTDISIFKDGVTL